MAWNIYGGGSKNEGCGVVDGDKSCGCIMRTVVVVMLACVCVCVYVCVCCGCCELQPSVKHDDRGGGGDGCERGERKGDRSGLNNVKQRKIKNKENKK